MIGRVVMKIAGRDAGGIGVVVKTIDDNYVLIDGEVRRRKCNLSHLEFLNKQVDVKEDADNKAVVKALKDAGFDVPEKKDNKKEQKPRPKRVRKKKVVEVKKPAKKDVKKPTEKKVIKPAEKPKITTKTAIDKVEKKPVEKKQVAEKKPAKPAEKSVAKPTVKKTVKKVAKPAPKADAKPTTKPSK